MKRTACFLLVILMFAACILAACDNGTQNVSQEESGGASIAESTEESVKNESDTTESKEETLAESVNESSETIKEESKPNEESSTTEVSKDESSTIEDPEPEIKAVEVLFSRYTQNPYFVMIGTCTMDAQVTAEYIGQSVTVDSYMGWFEVTLKNTNSSAFLDVSFSQTLNGSACGSDAVIKVKPTIPNFKGTRAIGSNNSFQFFLEQMVPDYEGGNLFPNSDISNMTSRVQSRLDQIHGYNRDAEIIYMIVPSPMTIYPELVPDYYTKGTGKTRYEQVKDGLEAAGATVIDLRDTFNEHKNDEMPLYYHLDSHWADYGAYLGYVELFEHISKRYPAAKPRGIDEFSWTADYYTSADACLYLDIPQINVKEYGYYREFKFADPSNITSVPRYRGMQLIYNDLTTEEKYFDNNNPSLPSCIVFRDSYSAGIYDILPERMDKTHYIGMWNYAWQNWLINSEHPQYVIYIVAEWNIHQVVYN